MNFLLMSSFSFYRVSSDISDGEKIKGTQLHCCYRKRESLYLDVSDALYCAHTHTLLCSAVSVSLLGSVLLQGGARGHLRADRENCRTTKILQCPPPSPSAPPHSVFSTTSSCPSVCPLLHPCSLLCSPPHLVSQNCNTRSGFRICVWLFIPRE